MELNSREKEIIIEALNKERERRAKEAGMYEIGSKSREIYNSRTAAVTALIEKVKMA